MVTHQKLKEKTGTQSTETERIKAAKVILYASDQRVNLETGQKPVQIIFHDKNKRKLKILTINK